VLAALVALPAASVPAAAAGPADRAAPGERISLEGVVRVVVADDFARGRSETTFVLDTEVGHVPLVVPDGTLPAVSGAGLEAQVTGTLLPGGGLRVASVEPVGVATEGSGSDARDGVAAMAGGAGAGTAATDAVYGWPGPSVRRVAVVIAGYTDAAAPDDTPDGIAGALTDDEASVRSFFETASRGRVTIDGTVLGPWSLPIDSCPASQSFSDTVNAVEARAANEGIDLGRFDHVLMWTPAPCGSEWTALGEAPGQFIQMSAPFPDTSGSRRDEWVNVAAHEMGHNMGLLHANALACSADLDDDTPVALSDWCGAVEYGDPFSTMGGDAGWFEGFGVHYLSPLFDSSELAHLGWLEPGEDQVVTEAGSYSLVPTYAAAEGVRLLRIRREVAPIETDPSMGYPLATGWLTIELRNDPPEGPFDTLVDGSPSTAGIIVRYVEDGYDPYGVGLLPALGSTYLVDAAPETVGFEMWSPELHDAPLTVGETLTDLVDGTQITLTELDAQGATVAIAFPDGPPPSAPVIAAPGNVSATAGNGTATVSWSRPTTDSAHPVEGYTVRSYPGGRVCFSIPGVHPRSCTVTGLANGTAYRFTVTAGTAGGYWQMSLPSNEVTPIGPPLSHMVPLATYRTDPSIPLAWVGHDDGEPVDSHDVRYRVAPWIGAFGSRTTWRLATATTAGTFTGKPGRTYCFSARSRNEGVTGPWTAETCTAVPLDDRSLRRSSGWRELTGSSYFRGTALRATRQGSSLTRTGVEAKRIALLVSTCADCGTLRVYWNGSLRKTISLASSTSRHKVLRSVLGFSSVRTGTLRLVVASSGRRVQVDGVAISRR
jgi:hypothetical protein